MSGFETASGALALVELSAKVASLCLQYSIDVKHAKSDIIRLRSQVSDLENASGNVLKLLDGPHGATLKASQSLRRAIDEGLSELEKLYDSLRPKSARQALNRLGLRSLKWPLQVKEVERVKQSLRQCTQTMSLALQIDQTSILLNLDQRMVLDRLPIADGASFDSSAQEHSRTCLPNTRVELLRQIVEWAKDTKGDTIFWLNGMAGTGKSTISRTVAQIFAREGRLGASFFFKRGEADRGSLSKFFTTIAADLVVRQPATAALIKQVLESDPSTATKNAREQFDKLFLQPLSNTTAREDSIVIVVDALDECERDDDIKLMIHLFSSAYFQSLRRIKIFLTSRPELPPRIGFMAMGGAHQDVYLHAVPEPVIARDICLFLEHELARIREEYNISVATSRQFSTDWPSDSDIKSLVQMAVPLFIFAATVCRFIADRKYGNPSKQLLKVLNYQSKSHSAALYETYQLVLNRQLAGLDEQDKDEAIQEFCCIVGPIIILATPLSISALAHILDMSQGTVEDRLDLLHSVLSVPESTESPVRLLHLSFRDFLLDSTNHSNIFWIDETKAHLAMATNCLRVLSCLKEDLCDMKAPGTPRSGYSTKRIARCLPPEVQYACLYWVYHAEKSGLAVSDQGKVYTFLTGHFLHWLEALSIMGRAYESIRLVRTLRRLLNSQTSEKLLELLDDAISFIGTYISVIDATPLQLYSSLLVFAPQKSIIRNTFRHKVKGIGSWPIVEKNWSQCIQTLEGHVAWVQSAAFSHDSALVASASGDTTVRIWHADTGKCIHVLEGHHGEVNSVAFSHDSALLASCDTMVRIWRVDTGEAVLRLNGHSSFVTSVAFSHDSMLLASASSDKTIRLWRPETGELVRVFEGHTDIVSSVTFSHDSRLLASGSRDTTLRIWCIDTGATVKVLNGHGGWVNSVAFSPESTLIASGSSDNSIRLWQAATWECVRAFEGHSEDVNSAVFSHDSKVLVSASTDSTIRLWNTDSGKVQAILESGHGVKAVALSHDSTQVVSASYDTTVRIWQPKLGFGEYHQLLQVHSDSVICLAITRDSEIVASGSMDNAVRIWSVATGRCIRTLLGHVDPIHAVAFSDDSSLVISKSIYEDARIWDGPTGECLQSLDIRPGAPKAFDQDTATALETVRWANLDCIKFTYESPNTTLGATSASNVQSTSTSLYGLSPDRCWITMNGDNWLWLPVDVRGRCAIARGSTVILGSSSGRVAIVGFSP